MSVNLYECLFLLHPNKSSDLAAVQHDVNALLEKNGATIEVSRKWNETKLTYPVEGHRNRCLYWLTYFRCEGPKMGNMENEFRLNQGKDGLILRYMIIAIHPKLEERMLELGRDENALAIQIAIDDSFDSYGGGDFGGGGGGGRRGGRRDDK